jgi:hypothetical protein
MQRDEFTGEAAQSAGQPVEDFDCIELFELRRIIDVMTSPALCRCCFMPVAPELISRFSAFR